MNTIQFILLCLLLILISYFVGLSLVTLIDNRLSKVSITLPSQEHVIKIDENNYEHFISKDKNKKDNETKKNSLNNNSSIMLNKYDNDGLEGFDNYSNNKKKYIENNNNSIKNKVDYQGNNQSQDYGITNYGNPNEMSEVDKSLFINNYPPNMTLQDYINWLLCFKNNKNKLKYIHLKNLELINNGKKLTYEEGVIPPPSDEFHKLNNSGDYFEKLYLANGINLSKNITEQENSDLKGYNIGNYTEFTK